MWNTIFKFGRKIGVYAATAFSGYEIGTKIDGSDSQTVKETTIITKENANTNIENIVILLTAMVFIAILFVSIQQIFKCIANHNKSNNSASANITLEAGQSQQTEPIATRRQI